MNRPERQSAGDSNCARPPEHGRYPGVSGPPAGGTVLRLQGCLQRVQHPEAGQAQDHRCAGCQPGPGECDDDDDEEDDDADEPGEWEEVPAGAEQEQPRARLEDPAVQEGEGAGGEDEVGGVRSGLYEGQAGEERQQHTVAGGSVRSAEVDQDTGERQQRVPWRYDEVSG